MFPCRLHVLVWLCGEFSDLKFRYLALLAGTDVKYGFTSWEKEDMGIRRVGGQVATHSSPTTPIQTLACGTPVD